MAYLFSYTECEAAGPFQAKAGFKIKSLAWLGDLDPQVERILNVTIANYPHYEAPKVDAYATRDEFLALEKAWSYQPVVEGHFAFNRLATSGTKMGRPGNPFHQSFVVRYKDLNSLINHATESFNLEHLTPADLYFWDWPAPRGDAEVEASSYLEGAAPIPNLSEFELSEIWEDLFQREDVLTAAKQFEARWLTGSAQDVFLSEQDFFGLLSLLLRMVPLNYSWASPFSSAASSSVSQELSEQLGPHINRVTRVISEPSEKSVYWSELAQLVVENGLQIEVIRVIQELSQLFSFSVSTQRQALSFLPLAVLVLPDQDSLLVSLGLRSAAWQVLSDVAVRLEFKSEAAQQFFVEHYISTLDSSELPPAAEQWLQTLEVIRP